jgi:Ohr subfamily peroxiredoxin
MKSLYTAHATATRGGRGTGTSATDDGKVSVNLSSPKKMGGDGGPGTNPDQLFAVGYSASFLGAMKTAAKREGKKLPDEATVTAAISFVDREDNTGFAIAAALEGHVPGMDRADVESLMHKAHDICPYSWAIKQTVDVKFSVG